MQQIPLNLIVIKVLSKGDLSGYDLMDKIKAETGYWKPSPGTIYPLLESLEKKRMITSKIDGKKKIYSLTHKARIHLKLAEAKKAAMAKYAIGCLNTYKLLFGNDLAAIMEEDEYLRCYLPELFREGKEFRSAMRDVMVLAGGQKDPKKVARVSKILRKASADIRKVQKDGG